MDARIARERDTAALFHDLFTAYDDEAFKGSVDLFRARFDDAGFDTHWFHGKTCLDAGCGGGRYSIALRRLGAGRVVGIDISDSLVADARRRAVALCAGEVRFAVGSVADLSFQADSFDFICHSGVLQHTADPVRVIRELARVLKPGGLIYMLVYATEGLRWPMVQMLRPIAQRVGFAWLDRAVEAAGLPVNRRRTYLDDLLVPYIDFYSWQCLRGLLEQAGFVQVERWSKGRLDHEEDLDAYARDLRGFLIVFQSLHQLLTEASHPDASLAEGAATLCREVVGSAETIASLVRDGKMPAADGRVLAIGQGHHRLLARKRLRALPS